jgi:hypothetical protein
MPPVLFALVIFEIGSHSLLKSTQNETLPFMLPAVAEMKSVHHYAQLFLLRQGFIKFLSGTKILPISAFQLLSRLSQPAI